MSANARDLFETAEPYMKAIDHAAYTLRSRARELHVRSKWREFIVPELVSIYMEEARTTIRTTVPALASSIDVRMAEIGYLVALGSGINSLWWAEDLTNVIVAEIPVKHLSREAVVALASYLSTIRALGQLAGAHGLECLGPVRGRQIDVHTGDDLIEILGWLYHDEFDALGCPAATTEAAIDDLVSTGEARFGEAPALLLLKWAFVTGFLRQHAKDIEAAAGRRVDRDHQGRVRSHRAAPFLKLIPTKLGNR